MKRLLPLVALLAGCGPELPSGPRLQLDLVLSAGLADTIKDLQVSLINRGTSLDCTAVQKDCLVRQVTTDRFIKVQDSSGREHLALTFTLGLKAGTPSTQDVSVQGIPLGKDYAVVIEALSKDTSPKLAGSSCNYLKEVTAGTNTTLIAATITPPALPVDCDPRVEK